MNFILASLLLISSVPVVFTTVHTTCYNYFLEKDGCVFSSASSRTRCPAPSKPHPDPVQPFVLPSDYNHLQRRESGHLDRRYDTTKPSFPIGSGMGICGFYNSSQEIGVCLWSGAEQDNPTVETAGWLNGLKKSNCGKQVYIQRTGRPETVQYARVIDGCSFSTKRLDVGCFEIGISIELFNRFNPTPKEQADQLIYEGLTWDFNNLYGNMTRNGPV